MNEDKTVTIVINQFAKWQNSDDKSEEGIKTIKYPIKKEI